MKFVWCHVKNVVFDSFLSSSSDAQGEWSHSVFLTTVVSCDCCILILTVRQRPCWYISWPQREQWGLKHTIHSWTIFIALWAFSRSAWTKALHVCNLYLLFSSKHEKLIRGHFCAGTIPFFDLYLEPPPPQKKREKTEKKILIELFNLGLVLSLCSGIHITCTSPVFFHCCVLTNFCESLCHIALPLFLYLHEELSLTDDDRLQNPVFLEWPPSPIHSHHSCRLDLQC